MFYTRLRVECDPEFTEILIAEIAEAGFGTFQETENGFEAFTEQEQFDSEILQSIRTRYQEVQPLLFEYSRVQKENWNEQWEKSIDPVIVDDQCIVRAEFHHLDRQYPYEIIITPKMSFGTGHHATTWLMLKSQLELDHMGKKVMDAGCGTCILSIMAEKRGASFVDAFDIDEWSTVNGKENIQNNNCSKVKLRQGTVRTVAFENQFDMILANINKNILLDEMAEYHRHLSKGGLLVLSGFYASDVSDLLSCAKELGFFFVKQQEKDTWCALIMQRD